MDFLKDSKIPYATIEKMVRENPITVRSDGGVVTCPVRLAFPHLGKPQTTKNDDGTERDTYNTAILFPPCAGGMPGTPGQIHDVLYGLWWQDVSAAFANRFVNGQPQGLHSPFHDQAEKANYSGYNPGAVYLNVSSEFKPQVVDSAMNPIPDGPTFDARVYPGVWAIVSLSHYAFGTKPGAKKRGASFGLSSVMIIMDDEKMGGGAEDVNQAFAGVKLDRQFNPSGAFGAPAAPPAAPSLIAPGAPSAVPAPPPAPAPPPVAKAWPQGFDPAQLAGAGWSAEQMLGAGYQVTDLVAYGVL